MDEALLQEIFEQLFQSLETAETQSAALLQFLKAKGIAKDEDLAPYFEQASKASSVRWVATRARINRLLSAVTKSKEKSPESSEQQPAHSESEPVQSADSERTPGNSKESSPGRDAKNESANNQVIPDKDSGATAETKSPFEENETQTQGKPKTQPEAA